MADDDERLVAWRGVDPDRVDAAAVTLGASALRARGSSLEAEATLTYELQTAPGWVTQRLVVNARGDGWRRSLTLQRDAAGSWSAYPGGNRPGPGTVPDGLDDAVDCDLARCPLTNTMPILRHGLLDAARRGERRSVDFVMAWVSVPDLAVIRSEQRYTSLGPAPDGGALVGFAAGAFTVTLHLDADGLVVDYPGLARRLAPEPPGRSRPAVSG